VERGSRRKKEEAGRKRGNHILYTSGNELLAFNAMDFVKEE